MKQQAVYRAEEKYGYWHIYRMSTLFPAKELVHTWYSSTPMTVRGQSRQQSHRFVLSVRTH